MTLLGLKPEVSSKDTKNMEKQILKQVQELNLEEAIPRST